MQPLSPSVESEDISVGFTKDPGSFGYACPPDLLKGPVL